MWAVSWSLDGKRIDSGIWDHTVQIWDATSGHVLVGYRGHAAEVWDVAWSPVRTYIASAGNEGNVRVWNATNGRQAFDLYI